MEDSEIRSCGVLSCEQRSSEFSSSTSASPSQSLLDFNCSSTYSTTRISINTPQNKNTEPQTDRLQACATDLMAYPGF